MMIANPCRGRVLMIAFPPPRPSRVTTCAFPSYYTIIPSLPGTNTPIPSLPGTNTSGTNTSGTNTFLGRTLHRGYINERGRPKADRASQTYAWTSRGPGDIIREAQVWDETGVSLTSEVGRRPTERVKLTLGHPAKQAT